MEKDYGEYVTFNVTTKDGSEAELALMDEFDFEGKHYVELYIPARTCFVLKEKVIKPAETKKKTKK